MHYTSFQLRSGCVRKAYLESYQPGGATMNLDSQATELLAGLLKGTDGADQVQEEALLVVGGLTARQPAKNAMYCSPCVRRMGDESNSGICPCM
jgi:hypothetical protein